MNSAFELLVASIGAAGCWALWFYFIKEYRVALLREDLFSLRDELFLLAADGEIGFDHPAYKELRIRLNAMIRFAHRITLPTLFIATRLYRHNPDREDTRWSKSLDGLAGNAREKLEQLHQKMLLRFTRHLIQGSPILTLLALCLHISMAILWCIKRIFKSRASRQDVKQRVIWNMVDTLDVSALETRAYEERLNSDNFDLQLV